jgi:diguanylate cyclase (GGDEF)-like protein
MSKGRSPFVSVSTSALGLHALAEGFYLYARVHWYEWAQPYIYILWILGAFCFLMAAVIQIYLEPAPREIYPSRTRSFLRLILPYLAVMAGWSTLLYITFTSGRLDIRLYGVLIGSLLLGALVLCRQYTLLVENFHLYADMQHLAITDSLTGLYNRHYFNQVLNRELLRAQRYNSPLALLLADVDDFKLFNDTLGHLQGDQVLKVVSNTLNTQLRRVDLLARFGGDEFAVIMPGTDQIGAEIASTRIREVVARQSYADKQLGLSIGVAVFVLGMSPEQFVEQADRELYRSKLSKTAHNTQSHP